MAKKISVLAEMTHGEPMFPAVDTRDLSAVQGEVWSIFASLFPEADDAFIARTFGWVRLCFGGGYSDYQQIDARYHDLEHTLQGTVCFVRLLRGRHFAGAIPVLTPRMFELGLLAILFHDTGYLKRSNDRDGTGAKYTLTHVRRSAEFARAFLDEKGYNASDTFSVQNMIRCTGVNVDLAAIPFTSDLEKNIGFALGTSDLLGQMAAEDYVEKLPVLYLEFAEAARFNEGHGGKSISFKNADDLMRNTPAFWEHYVWPKINNDFLGLYRHLNDPFPDGPNFYVDRVRDNIARLQKQISLAAN